MRGEDLSEAWSDYMHMENQKDKILSGLKLFLFLNIYARLYVDGICHPLNKNDSITLFKATEMAKKKILFEDKRFFQFNEKLKLIFFSEFIKLYYLMCKTVTQMF